MENEIHAGEANMTLPGSRHTQAEQVCELWLSLREGVRRSGTITDEARKEGIVSKLIELCAEEIFWALNDNLVGRVFCNVWIVLDYKHGKAGWFGDTRVLRADVERALQAKRKDKKADIVELVRTSVAEELAQRRDERIERLRSQKAREVLSELLSTVRRNPPNAAVLVDHLTNDQRSDLKVLSTR